MNGHEVRAAADGRKALRFVTEWQPDVVLTDIRMPAMDGIDLLQRSKEVLADVSCVIMTAYGSIEVAVDAMRSGADDFLTKPLDLDSVKLVINRALHGVEQRRRLGVRSVPVAAPSPEVLGHDARLLGVLQTVDRVAASTAAILITGETGTGKETIARRVHAASDRAQMPFVSVHCAARSAKELEVELFGERRGGVRHRGRLDEAEGGTLFLREIGALSLPLQVKLLHLLQAREFTRVGDPAVLSADVRVITSTEVDLSRVVHAGRFRQDLYYRITVIELELPPLRERRADIATLARHFVARYAAPNARAISGIDDESLEALKAWEWPGNVRELETVIERAVVLCEGASLTTRCLPLALTGRSSGARAVGAHVGGTTLANLERVAILETYRSTGGNTQATARILGISQRKVQYKLNEYRATTGDPES